MDVIQLNCQGTIEVFKLLGFGFLMAANKSCIILKELIYPTILTIHLVQIYNPTVQNVTHISYRYRYE
jgi:hypothetical protein